MAGKLITLASGTAVLMALALTSAADDPADPFTRDIKPLLRRRCLECHAGAKPDGGLDLAAFDSRAAALEAPKRWAKVARRLESGDMPPDYADPMPAAERATLLAWSRGLVKEARKDQPEDPGRVTLRRLNRAEYNHTIQDLFGLTLRPADRFPDDEVGYGFDTVGDVLSVPPLYFERALEAAGQVAAAAIRERRPRRRRWKATAARRQSSGGGTRDGMGRLSSNGSFAADFEFKTGGEYLIRARACAEQAGPALAKMSLRVGRRRAADIEVDARVGAAKVYQWRLRIPAGKRAIAVGFSNDYYKPKAKDPSQRDRNLLIDWFEVEGPIEQPRPTILEARLDVLGFPGSDRARWSAEARVFLAEALRRVYRRPPGQDAIETAVRLFDDELAAGGSFISGLRAALTYALASPRFLFRLELDERPDDAGAARVLDDHELATRLAYFLWCGPPDPGLDALADRGALSPALEKTARRMLKDPRVSRFVVAFAGQWLQLRRLSVAAPDSELFPGFDEELRVAMRIESEMVFEALLRENRGIRSFLDADFTFVNSRLARHYRVPEPPGQRWQRISAPPGRRGFLGHAAILTLTSNPTRSSPVGRGKWILEALLDDPPASPPPGNDALPPTPPGQAPASLRQRLELHRQKRECAACHSSIDPLGFALENYDAIGSWRRSIAGRPVDTRGRLPDGSSFEGPDGLRATLAAHPRRLARSLTRHLMVYALGRGTADSDDAAIDAIVEAAAPQYRIQDLILGIVRAPAFRKRRGERPPSKKTRPQRRF